MLVKSALTAVVLSAYVAVAGAQQPEMPTTNQDVIQMVQSGLSSEVTLAKINRAPCAFDSSTRGLLALKNAEVPPNIVAAVASRNCTAETAQATLGPSTDRAVDPPLKGATVYITPMNGFEIYLAAAFANKKVPMQVVTRREDADYILDGTAQSKKAGWSRIIFKGQTGSAETASVELLDRAGNVRWAYSVNKGNSVHGEQSSAEACAKHLKQAIEKEAKGK